MEFKSCELRSASFLQNKLEGMDFTTCHIEGLEVGIAEIKGMTEEEVIRCTTNNAYEVYERGEDYERF